MNRDEMPHKSASEMAERLHRRLFRITSTIRRQENDQMSAGGLTLTQCSLLYALRDKRRARISDLATHERLALPTVTRAVGRLRDLGMVSRTRDLSDHRNVWIEITPKGVQTQRAAIAGLMTTMLAGMSLDEIAALEEALAPLDRITRSATSA